MSYTLYGDYRSGACAVELALAEIGADYAFEHVALASDAQRSAEYAAVNPHRKVPALRDAQGNTVTESVAILLTLEERHPDAGLMPPRASDARAQALRWLLFVATELYPIVEINDYPDRFATGGEATADALRRRAREIWRERWLVVEAQVGGSPYLLPGGFSLADIYIAVVSRWAQQETWRASSLPRIERLASAVAERPALAAVWRKHFP